MTDQLVSAVAAHLQWHEGAWVPLRLLVDAPGVAVLPDVDADAVRRAAERLVAAGVAARHPGWTEGYRVLGPYLRPDDLRAAVERHVGRHVTAGELDEHRRVLAVLQRSVDAMHHAARLMPDGETGLEGLHAALEAAEAVGVYPSCPTCNGAGAAEQSGPCGDCRGTGSTEEETKAIRPPRCTCSMPVRATASGKLSAGLIVSDAGCPVHARRADAGREAQQ